MSTRKRVLVLTSTFPRWQGDNEPPFVFELSIRLAEHFDVVVLAPHAPGAARSENIDGIEVQRFRYFFTSWQSLAYRGGIMVNLKRNKLRYLLVPFFLLSGLFSLMLLLGRSRFDVIHAHWLIPNGMIAIAACALAARNRTAVLCTVHGSDLSALSGAPFRRLQRWVIAGSDGLTAVSAALRTHLAALAGRDDTEVIPMGVDLSRVFVPSDAPEIRNSHELLFAGRLVAQKGVLYLIAAMPEILKRYPLTTLTIVGDGPECESLQRLAEGYGVACHVVFMGAVENIALAEHYRRAAVFISPSLSEGFGLTLVEAMGCACPVVASDLPAIREIISDGVTGLLCRQSDSQDIAAKVCWLLEHPERREELGRAGRQYVQARFDWAATADRYADLIDGLARKYP